MNSLSNEKTRRGETNPPSIGFAPDAFPEAKSSKTGVSVRYDITPNKSWYVFRASYGREDMASDYLVETGTYTYIPKKYVIKSVWGKKKRFLQSLIPNLVFAYTTKDKAKEYVHDTPSLPFLTYYYNHFVTDDEHKNPPLIVSHDEMAKLVQTTYNKNEHLMFVDPSQCHYKSGKNVRIIDGPFIGVEGRVARVAGQQRVVVSLSNIGLIATAYIPSAFIEVTKLSQVF